LEHAFSPEEKWKYRNLDLPRGASKSSIRISSHIPSTKPVDKFVERCGIGVIFVPAAPLPSFRRKIMQQSNLLI
jgi:hypothetical protein